MTKLKFLKAYDTKDVPDYILKEITDLAFKIAVVLFPIIRSSDPNIGMAALNYVHASVIKMLVSDDAKELEKAGNLNAIALIKNLQILIDQMENENK